MTSLIKSFTEISIVFVSLTASIAQAGVLGVAGPLSPDANGNWQDFRTDEARALLSDASDDASCTKRLPQNLRQLFFEHFRYYVDHSKTKIGQAEIARFAKVIAMASRESSGDSAAVSDMHSTGGRTSLQFFRQDNAGSAQPSRPVATLNSLEKILNLTTEKHVVKEKIHGKNQPVTVSRSMVWNDETNFGLLQMSANRLILDFGGNQDQIAIDGISDMRTLYASHPEEVIERCGSSLMFKESAEDIRDAFDKLVACEPGTRTKQAIQCFGRWATLCPNYNITLALVAPLAYFQTHNATPLCTKTFWKILNAGHANGGVAPKSTPAPKLTPKRSPTKATVEPAEASTLPPFIQTAPAKPTAWPPFFDPGFGDISPLESSADDSN